jgi:hypothetical protein
MEVAAVDMAAEAVVEIAVVTVMAAVEVVDMAAVVAITRRCNKQRSNISADRKSAKKCLFCCIKKVLYCL